MKKSLWLLVVLSACSQVQASSQEVELLVQGCAEVEAIYDRQGQKHLYAGITTSVSEALRAGYCKGVIDQYKRNKYCGQSDWVEQAKDIARQRDENIYDVEQLLRQSCG